MVYDGPDEFPIRDVPDIPSWSENYAAMFASCEEQVSLFHSVGRWHGDASIWRELIMVSLPDDRILYHRGYGRASTETIVSGGLTRYEVIEPGRRVHLTFDGPMAQSTVTELMSHGARTESMSRVTVDLAFEGVAPIWNMKGDSDAAMALAGGMHIEQIGQASGTICCNGKRHSFDRGYAVRDHSRGPREIERYAGHNWLNGVFPDGTAFHVYAIKLHDREGVGMSNAVVIQGEKIMVAFVRHTEFAGSTNDRGIPHSIVLECEIGEMAIDVIEVRNSVPMGMVSPFDTGPGIVKHIWSGFLLDEAVRIRWNGQEGVGWSERGFVPAVSENQLSIVNLEGSA